MASFCSRELWEGFMVGTIHVQIYKRNTISSEKLVAVTLILKIQISIDTAPTLLTTRIKTAL